MNNTIAIGLLSFGGVVLLSALGVLHQSVWVYVGIFWPLLLVAGGVEEFLQHLRRGELAVVYPFLMVAAGLVLFLQNLHWFTFASIHIWSLLLAFGLIYGGLSMLGMSNPRSWRRARRLSGLSGRMKESGRHGFSFKPSDVRSFGVGEFRYGDQPWTLTPLDIHNALGGVRINLATAAIPDGETPIDIHTKFGEVRIKVPEDLAVDAYVNVLVGETRVFDQQHGGIRNSDIHYVDPNYDEALRKVKIRVSLHFGEVRLTRV